VSSTWQVAPGVEPDGKLLALLEALEKKPVSRLVRHTAPCCAIAEAWFRATARAATRCLGEELGWISEQWNWGPTTWPIAWCEAIRADVLDCGALAALAEVAFEEAGREVVRVQLIEEASAEECEQWAGRWAAIPSAPRWIWEGLVYHEAVSVLGTSGLRIWSATDRASRSRAVRFFFETGH
jgi:hypothetical protein